MSADGQDVQQFHISVCNVVRDYAAAHGMRQHYVIDVSVKSIAMIEYLKNATLCGAAAARTVCWLLY